MKCQNCGKNEAVFFQRTNINGHITETYLCQECAEKLGYPGARSFMPQNLLDGFFDERAGFMGRLFSPFFPASPRANGFGAIPDAKPAAAVETMPAEAPRGAADAELSRLRYINELREKMRSAAAEENFERAVELREEIKKLED
ncbi:MAG: UvrB/UvrC motif-containing protein [Oscillospiraceae bacterium]|jgi:protein-arginine kinase activator protein McsA|nr:UvrB/UvrC motif-containing protein [Oscillospiraceae bacterium]